MQISKVHFKSHSSPFFLPLPERGPHMQVQRIAMKENVWFHKNSSLQVLQISLQATPKHQDLHSHLFIYQLSKLSHFE